MLDLGGRIATQLFCADCVYRPQNNALLEWLIYNARRRIFETQIESRNMKNLPHASKVARLFGTHPTKILGCRTALLPHFWHTVCHHYRPTPTSLPRQKNPPNVIMMQFVRETDGKLFKDHIITSTLHPLTITQATMNTLMPHALTR